MTCDCGCLDRWPTVLVNPLPALICCDCYLFARAAGIRLADVADFIELCRDCELARVFPEP